MQPIGPKLAEGRDSEIFEHGRDKVLRVARDGRSLIAEAETMRFVRSNGFPCPDVYDAGDGYLVMDRLEGPTMMELIGRRILLRAFLSRVDTVAARRAIPAAVEHRLTDRNMSAEEHALMRQLAAWASSV